MTDIHHRIGIETSTNDVYAALTTIDGLSRWWTTDTHGDPDLGGAIVRSCASVPHPDSDQ